LPQVRDLFPAPRSDAARDAAFVQAVAMGLEQVDALKTQRPYLGERKALDYAAARRATLPDRVSTLNEVIPAVADYLQGLVIWGHPRTQENVIPPHDHRRDPRPGLRGNVQPERDLGRVQPPRLSG
jgi:hypothetical protein